RARALQELGRRKWAAFVSSQTGKETEVLFESKRTEDGLLNGLSDNYIRVLASGPDEWIGRTVPVRLASLPETNGFSSVAARSDVLWGESAL
ncbi:MAG: hypothetical protein J4F48_12700, partial [Nitrospinae bacterium]|nr:hypothetical protein [Nitrospinota bacterium]